MPNGYFCNEGIDSYVATPVLNGSLLTCLTGEVSQIYRFPRRALFCDDGNHRYLNSSAMYSYMVNDLGWSGEGIAFCAAIARFDRWLACAGALWRS